MPNRPELSRSFVTSGPSRSSAVAFPAATLLDLPERAVQFGTGGFLRGFVDHFIDAANRAGLFGGRVVAVGSTGSGRDDLVNTQDGLFTLVSEGVENGRPTREFRLVCSLSRALDANAEWDAVLEVARNPDIELVFSNTTEIGIAADPDETPGAPPRSFPGKLAMFLAERGRTFDYSPDAGVTILPCELVEKNGDQLRQIVLDLGRSWRLGQEFDAWISESVHFCNTLVDRIVAGAPAPWRRGELEDLLGYRDELLTICEPYRLFAIEAGDQPLDSLRFADADRGVLIVDDIEPYRLRKVRLLNGAHSLLAPLALECGVDTVYEAVCDDLIGAYLRRTMYDELVCSLDVPGAGPFAREVFERFSNPYLAHSLFDITLHGIAKMRVRVVPSIVEFAERQRRVPELIAFGFAAGLLFLRGDLHEQRLASGLPVPEDRDSARVRDLWGSGGSPEDFARAACADTSLWGMDLGVVNGFSDSVAAHLTAMTSVGVRSALEQVLFHPAASREGVAT